MVSYRNPHTFLCILLLVRLTLAEFFLPLSTPLFPSRQTWRLPFPPQHVYPQPASTRPAAHRSSSRRPVARLLVGQRPIRRHPGRAGLNSGISPPRPPVGSLQAPTPPLVPTNIFRLLFRARWGDGAAPADKPAVPVCFQKRVGDCTGAGINNTDGSPMIPKQVLGPAQSRRSPPRLPNPAADA